MTEMSPSPIFIGLETRTGETCGGSRVSLLISADGHQGFMLADAKGRFDLGELIHSLELLHQRLTAYHRPEGS